MTHENIMKRGRRLLALAMRNREVERDAVVIAAEDIRKGDVFDFAGATLRAETITYYDPIVEIEAVGPFNVTTVTYLRFEGVKVFLPRAEIPA